MIIRSFINATKLLLSDLFHKLNYSFFIFDRFNFKVLKELHKNGFYVLNEFISPEQADSLREEAYKFIQNNPDKISLESNGSDLRIYNIDRFTSTFEIGRVEKLSNSVFHSFSFFPLKAKFNLLGNIKAKEGNLGSGGGWHRDSPFMHQFKSIIYLSDVNMDSGPFEYIPGSHKITNIFNYSAFLKLPLGTYRFSEEQVESLVKSKIVNNSKIFTAKKGTLILVNTRGLHRGIPIKMGDRVAITSYHLIKKNDEFK